MDTTVALVLATITILFLAFLLVFFLRQRVSISLEEDTLTVKQPFRTRKINLNNELENWKVQRAYYLRWGVFYSINMLFTQGNRVAVSSLFNQEDYDLLYNYLSTQYKSKEIPD